MTVWFFLAAMIAYAVLFFGSWRKKGWRGVLWSLFYFYICAVFYLTILPLPEAWDKNLFDGDFGNFIPFFDLHMGYKGALKDILLNVLMTVPFGLLFPQISKRKILLTVLVGFVTSVTIEGIQLLMTYYGSPYHAFDVTDIISNTVGCLLGYLTYITIRFTLKDPKS